MYKAPLHLVSHKAAVIYISHAQQSTDRNGIYYDEASSVKFEDSTVSPSVSLYCWSSTFDAMYFPKFSKQNLVSSPANS